MRRKNSQPQTVEMGHFRLSCPPTASPFMSAAPPIAAVLSMDGCWSVSATSGCEQSQRGSPSLFFKVGEQLEVRAGAVELKNFVAFTPYYGPAGHAGPQRLGWHAQSYRR